MNEQHATRVAEITAVMADYQEALETPRRPGKKRTLPKLNDSTLDTLARTLDPEEAVRATLRVLGISITPTHLDHVDTRAVQANWRLKKFSARLHLLRWLIGQLEDWP